MATLTIRNLDEGVKQELRKRAAARGVSMEQEARDRLARKLPSDQPEKPDPGENKWYLEASLEEILAIGRSLPKVEFDQKREADRLYDYLDEQK